MSPVENVSQEIRWLHLRASKRVNCRILIAVEWSEGGRVMRAEGNTLDVSLRGCLAVVPQGFAMEQRLRVHNLTNGQSVEAVVIWKGHEGREGWELGIELLDPPLDFWGLEL